MGLHVRRYGYQGIHTSTLLLASVTIIQDSTLIPVRRYSTLLAMVRLDNYSSAVIRMGLNPVGVLLQKY